MSRPQKDGLDYFPHDVYASSDEKIEPLILLYGARGYAFYFLHLEYIYRNKDLTFDISDAETMQILCQKLGINSEEYKQILKTALKKQCFDKEFFEETGKLTSNGVKKRAEIVIQKREKMRYKYDSKSQIVSAAETGEETRQKLDKVKESKVKESKEKKSKAVVNETDSAEAEKIATAAATTSAQTGCFTCYNENIGLMSPHIAEKMLMLLDDGIEEDLIKRYIGVACERNIRNWAYIEKMAMGNAQNNIKTLEQYAANCVERETWGSRAQQRPEWEDWK
jgi:DnaD/phage-associated family protein